MDLPRIKGIRPALWWRSLIVVAYNTGLRRRSLFAARMANIDWKKSTLLILGAEMKNRRGQLVHLNGVTLDHLVHMRTDRELVFPWLHTREWFDESFHRLQSEAGIPRCEHFGLHNLRKTIATKLWEQSPAAAQLALGHGCMSITKKHYVAGENIVSRALDALPQPVAFIGGYPS